MREYKRDTFGAIKQIVLIMILHYLKTALRSIRSNWVYNVLSICCLAIGAAMFSAFYYGINYKYYEVSRLPLNKRTAMAYEDMPDNERYEVNRKMVRGGYLMPITFEMMSKLYIPDIEYVSGYGMDIPVNMKISDQTKTYLDGAVRGLEVCGDYFKVHNLTLLYGDRIPQDVTEMVVTESFLKKIKYDGDITQCTIRESTWNRDYSIVNVVKDDVWSRYINQDIFFNLDNRSLTVLINPSSINCEVVLRKGVDINDVNRQLATSYIHENSNMVVQLSQNRFQPQEPLLRFLSLIVLLVAAANFFKHMVMLLKQRGRANIVRYSLGAGKRSLSTMLMSEVALILIISLAIALYISFHVCAWLNTASFLGDKYFYFNDIAKLDILGICLVALAGAAVCIISVNRQNKLLKQRIVSEPRERKTLKYIVIGIETTIAVFALAVALHTFINTPRPYNPLPKSESRRTFYVENDERSNVEEFYNKVRDLPQVDEIVTSHGSWNSYPNIMPVKGGNNTYHFIFHANDIRYFSFFDIPIEWLDPVKPGHGFLLERSTYDELIRDGIDPNTLEFTESQMGESRTIHISGIFDHLICDDLSGYTDHKDDVMVGGRQIKIHRAFFFNENPEAYPDEFYVKFNKTVSPDRAQSLLKSTWDEIYPMSTDGLEITPIPEYVDEDFRFRVLAFNLGSIICILLVILSISSSISAETNMRRKEVALRKINGAKRSDIMAIFIKPYGIILAAAFVIGNLAALAFLRNDFSRYADSILMIAPITLVAMALIILFTIQRRIRIIMRTNPASVIKSE